MHHSNFPSQQNSTLDTPNLEKIHSIAWSSLMFCGALDEKRSIERKFSTHLSSSFNISFSADTIALGSGRYCCLLKRFEADIVNWYDHARTSINMTDLIGMKKTPTKINFACARACKRYCGCHHHSSVQAIATCRLSVSTCSLATDPRCLAVRNLKCQET